MVYSCSVLTAVVAVGIASSALAVPLPSSGALGGTVTVEAPIIDARELELSVHKDNEWHPLMHFGGGQPINADNALLLGKENLDAEVLVPIPIPVDVALEQHDHILDNYMGISQPDPMGILSKVEDQSLTLSLDVAGSAGGLSPIHIERRDLIAPMSMVPTSTAPMSDKEAMDHLRELPNAVRLTMKICITGKPEIQKKLEESKDWAEFINTAEVKDILGPPPDLADGDPASTGAGADVPVTPPPTQSQPFVQPAWIIPQPNGEAAVCTCKAIHASRSHTCHKVRSPYHFPFLTVSTPLLV
ncbi:hypothetical protein F5876DRAFT_78222 [Lentinula aff. lateritia]|uniref:Uncharacterized protein n=1 Tax=Lentinula aff. lateritia TaxID=2804960 RepID=A0ACC1TW42_9AGAR|nr:hypothetical protein F5876DRAFT_78222 [Lentinula aff. lateritia]